MKYLIVDVLFETHRAFHAYNNLSTTDGRKSGIIYGLLRILSYYKRSIGGKLYLAWDGRPVHRKEIDPAYKEGRAEWGHDMLAQVSNLKKLFSYLGIAQYENHEWEADDVMFSLADKFVHDGNGLDDIVIITGDDDLLQVVNDLKRIKLYNPRYKKWYHESEVVAKYGVAPDKLRLLWSIQGDASDGIVGVKGLGEVYSRSVASKYDNLTDMFLVPMTASIKNGKLLQGKSLIIKNYSLLELQLIPLTEIPISKNEQFAKDICADFELHSLMNNMQALMNLGE